MFSPGNNSHETCADLIPPNRMYTRIMIVEKVFESTKLGRIVGAHCSKLVALVVPGLVKGAQHRQNLQAYGASEKRLLSL